MRSIGYDDVWASLSSSSRSQFLVLRVVFLGNSSERKRPPALQDEERRRKCINGRLTLVRNTMGGFKAVFHDDFLGLILVIWRHN